MASLGKQTSVSFRYTAFLYQEHIIHYARLCFLTYSIYIYFKHKCARGVGKPETRKGTAHGSSLGGPQEWRLEGRQGGLWSMTSVQQSVPQLRESGHKGSQQSPELELEHLWVTSWNKSHLDAFCLHFPNTKEVLSCSFEFWRANALSWTMIYRLIRHWKLLSVQWHNIVKASVLLN